MVEKSNLMGAPKREENSTSAWFEESIEKHTPKLRLITWNGQFLFKVPDHPIDITNKSKISYIKNDDKRKNNTDVSNKNNNNKKLGDLENFITAEEIDSLIKAHTKLLNKLDQLENLKILKNFKPNLELDKLKVLEKLDSLTKLECLTKLDNLNKLNKIDTIDKKIESGLEGLEQLSRLENLKQLQVLSELGKIEKLDHLERLEKLDNLKQLSNIENLNILKDDKITKVLEKINNLPIVQDNIKTYLFKSFANTTLDFIKVLLIVISFFYFTQTHIGQVSTVTALELVGFSDSARTNLALNMIASSNDKKILKETLNNTILKIELELNNIFSASSDQLFSPETYKKISNIHSYNFSFNKFNIKTVVNKKINKQVQNARDSFLRSLDYYYAKDLISANDLNTIESIKSHFSKKQYSLVIKKSKSIKDKNYKFIEYALRVALFELYKSDKDKLKALIF